MNNHLQTAPGADLQTAIGHYEQARYDEALDVFTDLAVTRQDPVAQMWVGACHAGGTGVPYSLTQAFAWYLKAAEGGNVQAGTNVGAMLIMGQGCAVDVTTGLAWLEQAANEGDCGAQFNLATLYSTGKSVETDHPRATCWYQQAAHQGHYPSQARLGYCYQLGQGVEKNRVQAYFWLSLAARHGVGTALVQLEQLNEQMSEDQKQQAASLLEQWTFQQQTSSQRWQSQAV